MLHIDTSDDDDEEESIVRRNGHQINIKRYVYRTASMRDVELHPEGLECLKPGSYLKDDIIQFYLSYLINEVCPKNVSERVHIFDSIFSDQLNKIFLDEKLDRSKWTQLHKWYDRINIFEKDFLVFPTCLDSHWFSLIVCYPKSVKPIEYSEILIDVDEDYYDKDNSNHPGIIVMDSLSLRNLSISMKIRDFLDHTWRTCGDEIKRFSHNDLKDYFPKLPRQRNDYDCGLYMLMYIRCFLNDPDRFYYLVRKDNSESSAILRSEIKGLLRENDREKLIGVILDRCEKQS